MTKRKRITTVTLNAAIDKTYYLSGFAAGKVSRVDKVIAMPGGKGLNVARVARLLGEDVLTTGFAGGYNGQFIQRELDRQQIPHRFVEIPGESRICLNIMDERTGESTELLEPGPAVGTDDFARMGDLLEELAEESAVMVFSGSIPGTGHQQQYRLLLERVHAKDVLTILDTSGEALLQGVQAKPFMIKPNASEAARLFAGCGNASAALSLEEEIPRLQQLSGIGCIAVSRGAQGALAGCRDGLYHISAARITPVNPVGSGDAFVAGMACGLARGWDIPQCLRLAAACGAANALQAAAGWVDPADVERLLPEIAVNPVGA